MLQFELAGSAADARDLSADRDLVVESLEADLPLILGYVVGLFALCLLGRRVFRSRRARRLSNVAAWAVLVAAALDVLENRALASALDAEGYASDAWLWASVSTVVKFALLLVVGLVATSVVIVVLARLAAPRIRYALRPAGLPPTPGGLGICASGGGIRSACTTLGVLQVLRERGWLAKADHLVSVSGGGYMTGAMQLAVQPPGGWEERLDIVRGSSYAVDAAADEVRRVLALPPGEEQAAQLERAREAVDQARADVEGQGEHAPSELRQAVQTLQEVVQSVPADGAFAQRSPEFEHVRRHGRYIADSPKEWAVAAVVVLRGVIVSLALIAGTVTTLGLLLGGLYRLVPLADLSEVAVADPDLGAAVRVGGVVAPLLILAIGALAWAVQLVLLGWVTSISVPAMRFLRTVAVATTWGAVGIAVLTVGVPVLVWSYEQAAFLRERIGSPGAGLGTVLTTYLGALVAILSRHRSTLETAGKTGGRLRSWLSRGAQPTQESSGGLIQRAVVLVVLALLLLVLASLFAAVVAVTVPDAVVTTDDGPNAWRLYPQADELAPVLLALTALLMVALALVWWSESRQRSAGVRGPPQHGRGLHDAGGGGRRGRGRGRRDPVPRRVVADRRPARRRRADVARLVVPGRATGVRVRLADDRPDLDEHAPLLPSAARDRLRGTAPRRGGRGVRLRARDHDAARLRAPGAGHAAAGVRGRGQPLRPGQDAARAARRRRSRSAATSSAGAGSATSGRATCRDWCPARCSAT